MSNYAEIDFSSSDDSSDSSDDDCGERREVARTVESKVIPFSHLESLPDELKLRIVMHLSARQLCTVATSSKEWRGRCLSDFIWKGFFLQRFHDEPGSVSHCGWHRAYVKRDKKDRKRFLDNDDDDCAKEFLRMQQAQREISFLESKRVPQRGGAGSREAAAIANWKMGKTFASQIDHNCSGLSCEFFITGNIYVCKTTAKEHVCGRQCEISAQHHNGVCEISGIQTSCPLIAEDDDDEDEAENNEVTGFFQDIYSFGYNADEREMRLLVESYGERRAPTKFHRQ